MDVGRNIELKARDANPEYSLEVCQEIGAEDQERIWQTDTYFRANHAGLKLREETPGHAHLIQFVRADQAQERESRYWISEVENPQSMLIVLDHAIGIKGVVEKQRHLFLWQTVRIHLDQVTDLGSFIELEAVAPPEPDLVYERELVSELRERFRITDDRLIAHGYADQLGFNIQ